MRIVLIAFVALFMATSGKSQLLGSIKINPDELAFPPSSNEDMAILKNGINSGLFISKQSFQICDKETGELFGLNGKKEFGIQYTVGIKIPNGFLLPDKAIRPWLYNNKFDKYKEKYDPVFYQATFSELGEQVQYDSLDYALTKQQELVDTTLYRFSSKTFGGKGFVLENTSGKKEGWIVWITTNKGTDFEQTGNLNYTIYRKNLTINKKECFFEIDKPTIEQEVLGGIYVVPAYTEIGVVEFRLCGIIAPQNDKWKIFCPFIEVKDARTTEEELNQEEKRKDELPELTPVEKRNDEKAKDKKKRKK